MESEVKGVGQRVGGWRSGPAGLEVEGKNLLGTICGETGKR
jgi:hypothetical protein